MHGGVASPVGAVLRACYLCPCALQVLCLSLAISPSIIEAVQNSPDWQHFITDILLLTRHRWVGERVKGRREKGGGRGE